MQRPDVLVDGELVDDRALEQFESDRFGHADFVRELAGVVQQAPTPANIALFGPWGSGKSGIANLLATALPRDAKTLRFVVFDASKYAQAPLRRYFISQIAERLGISDRRFRDGLYAGEETRDIRFRAAHWGRLLAIAAVIIIIGLAGVLAWAALSKGAFDRNWSEHLKTVKSYVLVLLPVAAVLTTIVKLAVDGFYVNTTRSAPSGDEEFEELFRDVVKDARTKRLVVFIDELDRCSPAQVASTLETMKTFLSVRGCVFVVAADQQVLEQALRHEVRQHTPEDTMNPYYSAGSSYLDKVFQYQLTLPPLRSATLSRFALGLVENLPGVWQRIPALDEVVSVLVPTHVVSPRRVKVLLNRFAIAYRLAERRADEGLLDAGFRQRAPELAKLVCLQCEFPLFAEALTRDVRLPELVRMSADRESLPDYVSRDVVLLARAFAQGQQVVAELLVEAELSSGGDLEMAPAETTADTEAASPEDPEDEAPVAGRGSRSRGREVARQHAQQLVNYLRKTRHVQGPRSDLLYLESAGADHGLDAALADRLQRAALDNATAEVLRLVGQAPDEDQARGALLVLADVVRQGQPGLEGRNVVSALMQAIALSGVSLDGAADSIADAVASHVEKADLLREDLMGALILARACNRAVRARLVESVISHPSSTSDPDVAVALLSMMQDVPVAAQAQLGKAVATALLAEPEDAARALLGLPEAAAIGAVQSAKEQLQEVAEAHYHAVDAQADDEQDAAHDVLDPPPEEALATVFDILGPTAPRPAREVLKLMLRLDRVELRSSVSSRLRQGSPIRDEELISLVLAAVRRRHVSEYGAWLEGLDGTVVGRNATLARDVDAVAIHLWFTAWRDDPPSAQHLTTAVAALGTIGSSVQRMPRLIARVKGDLADPFSSDDVVERQAARLKLAGVFVDAGLLDRVVVADVDLMACGRTLDAGRPGATVSHELVVPTLVDRVQRAAPEASESVLQAVRDSAEASEWLSGPERAVVVLSVSIPLNGAGDLESPMSPDELRSLAEAEPGNALADLAIALWIANWGIRPDDVWSVIEPMLGGRVPRRTRSSLESLVGKLSSDEHFAFVDRALQRTLTNPVDDSFYDCVQLPSLDQHRLADVLIEIFRDARRNEDRRRVINLWMRATPTIQRVRRRLVDEIYLPLVKAGPGGLNIALSAFGLVTTVPGVRTRVRRALRESATTKDLGKRVERRLEEARWTKTNWRGRTTDITEGDS